MARRLNHGVLDAPARGAVGLLCRWCSLAGPSIACGQAGAAPEVQTSTAPTKMDEALAKDWLDRWERNISSDARSRYCDREMGEELGGLGATPQWLARFAGRPPTDR